MSKFQEGSIHKIIVKDFVTYSYTEMLPGPNLNMLIGPNGSGKSTIVAAIILGLGGSPKTVGRGKKISEYVKHNCSEATINIQLNGSVQGELISITRIFDLHDKSTWLLNNKKVPLKEIEGTIQEFNIQVDNLCQFLPQDRVQDFAKMNKQQLLQQTQIAICRDDLISKQDNLIQVRSRHKELQNSIEKCEQKLQELQEANIRIEGKVQNLAKKKKYVKFIEDVDRKLAWLKYEKLRSQMDEIKVDKVKATEICSKHKDAVKPIKNAIDNAKKTTANIEQKVTDRSQRIREQENVIQRKLDLSGRLKHEITTAQGDLDFGLSEIDRRNQNIAEMNQQINNLVERKREILQNHGDDSQRDERIHAGSENIKKLSAHINKLIEKKGDADNVRRNKNYELRCFENELTKLENVKQQRLEWLRRTDRHAYAGFEWLRENRHMFKGEVFGPMMLELNVLNPQHAIYIENTIPFRDKVAFTCVLKEDMNLLIRMLREQQKLSVSVVHSGHDQPGLQHYRPAIPIEQLKSFGMFAYVRSLVSGPEPIMKYLCKTYHIHNTPVGNHSTNQLFDSVPAQISNFFSDNYRFSTSYSQYTRQKSTRQVEIKSDGSLAISIDAERMEMIRGQLADVQKESQDCDEHIHTLDTQITQLNEKQRSLRESLKELQRSRQDIQRIDTDIRVLQTKSQQLQTDPITREQLENECDSCIKRIIQKLITCQNEIKAAFTKYSSIISESDLDRTNLEMARKQVAFLENKSEDVRRLCDEAEETLRRVKDSYANAVNEAKVSIARAKQLSKGFTPDQHEFDEFRQAYDSLSNNFQELEAEKDHILSKIDYLNTADVGELQEYEQRQRQIAQFQVNIQEENDELNVINRNMDNLQEDWLKPLQELVDDINAKFSAAFRRLGCAGDISVYKGENEKDFADYGLSIKVKYRDAEPLQELNSIVQSGGERAVATAAFMLSLQELTPVPFRCVDEINQGMDSNNERRIFELLVDATSQENSSQYFFITPKLVPNLKFVRAMKIHFVHNGPFVPQQAEWNNVKI